MVQIDLMVRGIEQMSEWEKKEKFNLFDVHSFIINTDLLWSFPIKKINGIIIFGRNFGWEFTLTNGCFIDKWFLSRDGMNCDIIIKFFFHKKLAHQTKKNIS